MSIDRSLLASAEAVRRSTGESRSAIVSRALLRLLADEVHREKVARYVQAYEQRPESAPEGRRAHSLAVRSLRHLEWDES